MLMYKEKYHPYFITQRYTLHLLSFSCHLKFFISIVFDSCIVFHHSRAMNMPNNFPVFLLLSIFNAIVFWWPVFARTIVSIPCQQERVLEAKYWPKVYGYFQDLRNFVGIESIYILWQLICRVVHQGREIDPYAFILSEREHLLSSCCVPSPFWAKRSS